MPTWRFSIGLGWRQQSALGHYRSVFGCLLMTVGICFGPKMPPSQKKSKKDLLVFLLFPVFGSGHVQAHEPAQKGADGARQSQPASGAGHSGGLDESPTQGGGRDCPRQVHLPGRGPCSDLSREQT